MPSTIADTTGAHEPIAPGLKKKHLELVAFHNLHAGKIERLWRSLNTTERLAAISSEDLPEPIIAHDTDGAKNYREEFCCLIAPEWNVRDLVEAGSDHLLDLLRARVSETLLNQCCTEPGVGASNSVPDLVAAFRSLAIKGYAESSPSHRINTSGEFIVLDDKDWYGDGRLAPSGTKEPNMEHWVRGEPLILRRTIGRLILLRQEYTVTRLSSLSQHLVKLQSWITKQNVPSSVWAREGQRAKHMRFFEEIEGTKHTVGALIERCSKLRRKIEAELDFTSRDPFAFRSATAAAWKPSCRRRYNEQASRDDLEVDEKPRAIFTAFYALSVLSNDAKYWEYIVSLLRMYQRAGNKRVRDAIVHEVKAIAQQQVESAAVGLVAQIAGGRAWNVIAVHSRKPTKREMDDVHAQNLSRRDDHLSILLSICRPGIDLEEIIAHLELLGAIHEYEPSWQRTLSFSENNALCKLARHAGFYSAAMNALPGAASANIEGTTTWSNVWKEHCATVKKGAWTMAREESVWGDFAIVAPKITLQRLYEGQYGSWDERAVRRRVEIYEKVASGPVLEKSLKHFDALVASYEASPRSPALPLSARASSIAEETSKSPQVSPTPIKIKVKVKTRPKQPSTAHNKKDNRSGKPDKLQGSGFPVEASAPDQPHLIVKPQTVATFTAIFAKAQARGDVNWTAFTAAMTDLGFSVIPKQGAMYTFAPPANKMPGTQGFGLHRPHNGVLEGFRLLNLARRLTRRYGWTLQTFESA
ncbi:hypothetical protein Micbo1qcDRAFT_177196 [Microdochium bolleyi]|uniref:Uncharacterized protein n=1 Tax=Microdochium bolleyi TaxID=196109 RepID=A0A136IWP7_9PEZI|nr:hypothetical protein Micbo1qcDRAFT_177196 [Microdochium bolleyi]